MADPIPGAALVRIFKGEGLTVKTPHPDWMTHERDKATGKTFGPVHGVIIHHTASHDSYSVVYNGHSGLPGPLAHAYIDKAGVVWMCSDGRANHAGGGDPDVLRAVTAESYMSRPPAPKFGEGDKGAADGNDAFYGFECENLGDGKDPWPHVQYIAMVRAAAAICRYYGWSEKSVIGHLEWSNQKIDPKGFGMITFRADLAACLRAKPGTWPSETPVPPPVTVPTTPTKGTPVSAADDVWKWDGVAAVPPPYNNSDWDTNKQWSAAYALGTTAKTVREIKGELEALSKKVDQLIAKLDS